MRSQSRGGVFVSAGVDVDGFAVVIALSAHGAGYGHAGVLLDAGEAEVGDPAFGSVGVTLRVTRFISRSEMATLSPSRSEMATLQQQVRRLDVAV
jgi:hypothetical protein